MLNLRQTEKDFLLPHLYPGGAAADFTMGNGNDTLFLSRAVGETGTVYAFDIQPQALEHTRQRLEEAGAPLNYHLFCASHHTAAAYITRPLCAGIFNLGFLPGGDKSVTTLRETTLPAVRAALGLLEPKGALLVAVYPGHEEGRLEGELLQKEFCALPQKEYSAACLKLVNAPDCPYFYLIEKNH